nr:hypothetical protein GCM10017745_31270 [Saccharothrix mutabilis subsp. capreolus]
MADPSTYRPATGSIPDAPGVYKFRDANRRVIYVGKAKSLRSRLNSYFADVAGLHPRTRQMVTTAAGVEWTVVTTEVEALQLEYNWIKEFDPRFNVRYRDDKSYPVLAVTLNEDYPRLHVYRGPRRKGVRYFGPYAHAWAIRETLDLLLRVFPARTCSAGVFKRHNQIGRPCLLGYIDKCSAPCVGKVTREEHRDIVLDFCDFLAGRTDAMVRKLDREMTAAAEELEFEKAARLRDDLSALKRALEKQAVVLGDGTDADVVAFAQDDLEVSVQVFHVRGGRVRGQRGWVVDKVEEAGVADLVDQFVTQFYGEQVESAQASGIESARCRARCWCPSCPTTSPPWSAGWATCAAGRSCCGCRSAGQAGADGDRRAQRQGGLPAAQAQARGRPHGPVRGPPGAPGGPRAGHRPAAHRVHRHQPRPGHGRGGLAGRLRGRPGAQVRVPALRRPRGGRPGRRGVHRRGGAPPVPGVPEGEQGRPAARHRPGDRQAAQVRLRAQPARGRRRRAAGPGRERRAGRAGHHGRGRGRPGQAAGGGVGARRARPGDPAAHQRGPLPAATGPRRGAPVRRGLPPPEAVQAHDDLGTGRRAGSRADAESGAAQALRLTEETP